MATITDNSAGHGPPYRNFTPNKVFRKTRKGDIAFWSYDRFPFLLWGEVSETKDGGTKAFIPSYNGWFRVRFSLPPKAGEKMIAELKWLIRQHEAGMKRVRETNARHLRQLLFENYIDPTPMQHSHIEEGKEKD